MTEEDLAGRAGISRRTLQKIERGDLKCEIGLVFEDANIVGVKLFPESVTPESRSARNAGVGRRRAGTYLLRRMPSVEQSIIPEKPLR